MSARKSNPNGQLKWHNTLPEDFSNRPESSNSRTPGGRKRQPPSTEGLNSMITTFQAQVPSFDPGVTSPTKRRRNSSSTTKTPTKLNRQRSVIESGSASSGMQTPPPSSSNGTQRRRGRPPSRVSSATKTAPLGRTHRISSSPSKPAPPPPQQPEFKIPDTPFARKALYWDNGLDRRRGEIDQSQIDWNLIRGSFFSTGGSSTSHAGSDTGDIFLHPSHRGPPRFGSPTITEAQLSDSAQFSFTASDDRQWEFEPDHVNPSHIFSEPGSTSGSIIDGHSSRGGPRSDNTSYWTSPSQRPYHHQYLQRLREQEERARRKELRQQQKLALQVEKENAIPRRGVFRSFSDRPVTRSSPKKAPVSVSKTKVMLDISPGGTAKTKATVIYEPPPPASPTPRKLRAVSELTKPSPSPGGWDSLDESDSSYDGDTPRGLAPDGGEYITFRRQSNPAMDPFLYPGPPAANTRARTPRKVGGGQVPQMMGFAASVAKNAARGRDDSIPLNSSPMLPTPFKSSPPIGAGVRWRGYQQGQEDDEEESEAETVVEGSDEENQPPPSHHSHSHSQRGAAGRVRLVEDGDGDETEVEEETEVEDDDEEDEAPLPTREEEDDDVIAALRRATGRTRRAPKPDPSELLATPTHQLRSVKQRHSVGSLRREGGRDVERKMDPTPVRQKLFELHRQQQEQRGSARKTRGRLDDGFADALARNRQGSDGTIEAVSSGEEDDGDQGQVEGVTRCVCGKRQEEGRLMVQCDSCKNWLHIRCLGYSRRNNLPAVFVCAFCTTNASTKKRGLGRTVSMPGINLNSSSGGRRRDGRRR